MILFEEVKSTSKKKVIFIQKNLLTVLPTIY